MSNKSHVINPILEAATEIQSFCLTQGWQFCLIGGLAVQHWGEPRATQDADMTLLTGFGDEARYIDALLAHFAARLPDARDFALRYRVLLLFARNGFPIDIACGGMPFEEHSIERATWQDFGAGYRLLTCSAEDLVIHKAFAGRPQDWLDIETILIRQRGKLRWQIIWDELTPLAELKEDPSIVVRLRELADALAKAKKRAT